MLAPTLFLLYMSATLELAFSDIQENDYIQTRKKTDLLNEIHFECENKSVSKAVRKQLFADESTIVAQTPTDTPTPANRFADASTQSCLQIIAKATECLYRPPRFISDVFLPTTVSINK